jgi:hypothetical protein
MTRLGQSFKVSGAFCEEKLAHDASGPELHAHSPVIEVIHQPLTSRTVFSTSVYTISFMARITVTCSVMGFEVTGNEFDWMSAKSIRRRWLSQ